MEKKNPIKDHSGDREHHNMSDKEYSDRSNKAASKTSLADLTSRDTQKSINDSGHGHDRNNTTRQAVLEAISQKEHGTGSDKDAKSKNDKKKDDDRGRHHLGDKKSH